MLWGRSRRGSASGIAAVILGIMLVGTGVSAAMIYYSRGGSLGAGANSLSGALSDQGLSNLTSGLGGLSSDLSNSSGGGPASGPVVVADPQLSADGFAANGTTSTFTCSSFPPSGAYIALTVAGNGSAAVTSVSIRSVTAVTTFTPSGPCSVSAPSGETTNTYIAFPATSEISADPLQGSFFAGAVSLSDSEQIPFDGAWQ